MKEDIKEKIENLRAEIESYNHHYYVLSEPLISDFEFDKKLLLLQELEESHPEYYDKNSPTQRVASDISKNFKQETHRYPMLSLSNTYTKEELADFYTRVQKGLDSDFELV